jgi:hypothetical protein
VPVITNSRRQRGSARRAGAAGVDVIKTTLKHAGGKARGIPIPVCAAIVSGVTSDGSGRAWIGFQAVMIAVAQGQVAAILSVPASASNRWPSQRTRRAGCAQVSASCWRRSGQCVVRLVDAAGRNLPLTGD